HLRPDYAPGWEHLAYIRIAEGDSAGALAALDTFKRLGDSTDAMSGVLQAFHEVGFAWRFLAPAFAARVTQQVVERPVVQRFVAQLSAAVAIFDPGAIVDPIRGTWLDALAGRRAPPAPPGPVRRLLSADSLARAGDLRGALAASAPLAGDSAAQDADVFLRTA